jgi:hypothetical protein
MQTYPSSAIGAFTTSAFTSMADHKPDSGFQVDKNFSVITFESEAGYEKRRLRSRRGKRSYQLTYTNLNGLEKFAVEAFYDARNGEFEAFILDLSHVNETGTITVRFDGNLQIQHVLSGGSDILLNFYTVSFKLKETFS